MNVYNSLSVIRAHHWQPNLTVISSTCWAFCCHSITTPWFI